MENLMKNLVRLRLFKKMKYEPVVIDCKPQEPTFIEAVIELIKCVVIAILTFVGLMEPTYEPYYYDTTDLMDSILLFIFLLIFKSRLVGLIEKYMRDHETADFDWEGDDPEGASDADADEYEDDDSDLDSDDLDETEDADFDWYANDDFDW